MPKLSIVICLYNTDKQYFSECLHSIFSSTAKDYEVIVVDDGSKVDYSDVIGKYKNIRYFKTENKGTLNARIFGAEKCKSEYVVYMDSDDIVSTLYFDAMIKTAEKTNADIIINDWVRWICGTKYYCKRDHTICKDISLKEDQVIKAYMKQEGKQSSFYVLWNKLIKRDVLLSAINEIKKLNLERMVFAEDVLITFYVYLFARSMVGIHVGHYAYRFHENQETNENNEEKLKRHIKDQTRVFDIIENVLEKNEKLNDYIKYLNSWKNLLANSHYFALKRENNIALKDFLKENYKVKKIKKHIHKAGWFYEAKEVLPINLDEIEKSLKDVVESQNVKYVCAKSRYTKKQLKNINKVYDRDLRFANSKKADIIIQKEKYDIKQQLIHNVFVAKVANFLFPRGSKIREKVKKKLKKRG